MVGMMQDAHSRTRPARPLACIRTILEVQYAATYIRVWIICAGNFGAARQRRFDKSKPQKNQL